MLRPRPSRRAAQTDLMGTRSENIRFDELNMESRAQPNWEAAGRGKPPGSSTGSESPESGWDCGRDQSLLRRSSNTQHNGK